MKNILFRIEEITHNEGISISKMETIIGASKGVLSKALSKNSDIQSKWIQLIMEMFPMYNAEWLLTGKGDMLKSSQSGEKSEIYGETPDIHASVLEKQAEYVSEDKRYIELLRETIQSKDQVIKAKEETIEMQNLLIKTLKEENQIKKEALEAYRTGKIVVVNQTTNDKE